MSRRLRTLLALALVAAPLGLAGPAPASAFGLSCDSPYYCITFTMELFGNGSGSVITVDADGVPDGRVSCTEVNGVTTATSVCSARYRGLIGSNIYVRFTASPATGSCLQDGAFGPCITTAKTQTWQSQYDFAQGAEFHLLPEHVSVTTTGEGTGRATSSPTGIDCPPTCSADFPYGLLLTLTATPDAGAAFKAWTGACAGQGPICKLKPKGAVSTNAVFGLAAAPTAPPTAAPAATPRPTPASIATTAPSATVASSDVPGSGGTSGSTATPTSLAPVSSPLGGGPSAIPAGPAAASATDLTPIGVAIVAAGVLIALAVLVTGRRGRPAA